MGGDLSLKSSSAFRHAPPDLGNALLVEATTRHSGLAQGLVHCFVAGEELEMALTAARGIADHGLTTALDLLGENIGVESAAAAAAAAFAAVPDSVNTPRRMSAAAWAPTGSGTKWSMGSAATPRPS